MVGSNVCPLQPFAHLVKKINDLSMSHYFYHGFELLCVYSEFLIIYMLLCEG
jgi:hypothetical protein